MKTENAFDINSANSYLLLNEEGKYELYVDGEYKGTVTQIFDDSLTIVNRQGDIIKWKKAMILTIFCVGILFSAVNVTVYAKQPPIQYAATNDIAPYSTNYEWIYKSENGSVYRRLYDNTNHCRIGDWELCP